MSPRRSWAAVAVCLFALSGACDDPPKPEAAKPAKSAAAPAPTPTASAATPPEPKAKPKKTLADCGKGPEVLFDDKGLEAEVRKKLSKPEGTITRADLGNVRSLNLAQVKLVELDPCVFPYFIGVKDIFLGPGEVEDLTPISGLPTLLSIRASANKVKDLTPVAKLGKLDRLDLGRTLVSDLKPLESLTVLTELQLDDCPVTDISPLAKLTKLERLSLQRTQVKDFSPLRGLKSLKFLYVAGILDFESSSVAGLKANGTKIVEE